MATCILRHIYLYFNRKNIESIYPRLTSAHCTQHPIHMGNRITASSSSCIVHFSIFNLSIFLSSASWFSFHFNLSDEIGESWNFLYSVHTSFRTNQKVCAFALTIDIAVSCKVAQCTAKRIYSIHHLRRRRCQCALQMVELQLVCSATRFPERAHANTENE